MKYIQRTDLPEQFEGVLLDSEAALAVEDVVQILCYVAKGPVPVSKEIVQDVLSRLEPSRKEQIMASFGASFAQEYLQEYFDKGFAEGEARGKAEARAEGEAKGKAIGEFIGQSMGQTIGKVLGEAEGRIQGQAMALIRVLEKRLGSLPPHLYERICSAKVESIQDWLDRAANASDLQSVFGSEARGWSRPLEHETH